MELELIRRVLPLDLGKTAKMVLLVMSAHFMQKRWFVTQLVDVIGGDAKTIRFAMKELLDRKFVLLVGKTEMQAHIFELNYSEILKYDYQLDEKGQHFSEEHLKRQARQHRLPRNIQSRL